jgi:hypothetical protein
MTRRSSFAALVAVAVLAVGACTNNDAKRSDIENAMTDAGLDEDQAICIADGIEAEYGENQDLMNDIASADEPSEFPADTEPVIDGILQDCLGGGADGAGADDATADDESTDEETTTTEG